ncbi:hypothetical protein [uncultured Draconibacterium sp.]|uniref:hypothetical protein n=1 Tax=uncultured Draconibacterium sp. TaxID=1573823 RepID=UPI0025EC544A|nr:hypothetical protein [uncultured Draconibacterium sp.]
MKHYYLDIRLWQPKNRANEAMQQVVKDYSCCVVDEGKLQEIKESLKEITTIINEQYPRCSDMKFHYIDHRKMHGGQLMGIEDNFQISITDIRDFILMHDHPASDILNPASSIKHQESST